MSLSILIPSIETRADYLSAIIQRLRPQLTWECNLVIDVDDGDISIGAKRNRMMRLLTTEYMVFIDDDDDISDDYIPLIMNALSSKPDVVGFKMNRYEDGILRGEQSFSLANGNDYRIDSTNPQHLIGSYPPSHLCPIKTAIAQQYKFKDWNTGEDRQWQKEVYPWLNTEVFIDKVLYHYYYRTERPKEVTHRLKTWKR